MLLCGAFTDSSAVIPAFPSKWVFQWSFRPVRCSKKSFAPFPQGPATSRPKLVWLRATRTALAIVSQPTSFMRLETQAADSSSEDEPPVTTSQYLAYAAGSEFGLRSGLFGLTRINSARSRRALYLRNKGSVSARAVPRSLVRLA